MWPLPGKNLFNFDTDAAYRGGSKVLFRTFFNCVLWQINYLGDQTTSFFLLCFLLQQPDSHVRDRAYLLGGMYTCSVLSAYSIFTCECAMKCFAK